MEFSRALRINLTAVVHFQRPHLPNHRQHHRSLLPQAMLSSRTDHFLTVEGASILQFLLGRPYV